MAQYQRGAHTIHDIKLHFVWVTKYRKPILKGAVSLSVREIVRRICMEQEVTIINGHVSYDHVHLFVSVPPHLSPSSLMQSVKGKSSHYLFHEHPFLKKQLWGQHLWSRGYFCASSGTVTDEVIKECIEHQDKPHDDGFDVADDAQ